MSKAGKDLTKSRKKTEEKKLIDRSVKGDEKAFSILYRRYYSQVYSFCARMLRGRFDVDDAVQQVFLEAWRSMKRFEGRSMFSTWITKIAIHTCLSFHRKNNRLVLSGSDDSEPLENGSEIMWANPSTIPEEQVLEEERKVAVHKLLERMTHKKKQVFVMSDMQGMTAPEIGQLLKIPDATVRTRLFHARKEFTNWTEKNKIYRDLLIS